MWSVELIINTITMTVWGKESKHFKWPCKTVGAVGAYWCTLTKLHYTMPVAKLLTLLPFFLFCFFFSFKHDTLKFTFKNMKGSFCAQSMLKPWGLEDSSVQTDSKHHASIAKEPYTRFLCQMPWAMHKISG